MDQIILPRDTNVIIASFGGVGTTFLLKYLAQYKKTNHRFDADRIKHSPLPPISFNSNIKFVYVYGSPQLATVSLFQRNFQCRQSKKLQKWSKRTFSPIPESMTLQEYASQGIDKFCFRNHFYNWYEEYLSVHPTMFVRYETIYDNLKSLQDFLNLPQGFLDRFPKKKSRTATLEKISPEIRDRLDRMYGDFSDELARLDDVEIRARSNRKMFMMTYLKNPYLKALAGQCLSESKIRLKEYIPPIYSTLKRIKHSTNRLP